VNATLLQAILTEILVPEIAAVIRAHHAASGGSMPTDAQVIAALGVDADRYIALGAAFLASKGAAVPGAQG
jgi:hypothetical protein